MNCPDPYIQSVTISIPSNIVYDDRKTLSNLFNTNQWGDYCKYGDISYLLINLYNSNIYGSIFNQITNFLSILCQQGILLSSFPDEGIRLHEIRLRFDISISGLIFCKTGYFNKVDKTTYRSNDYRQKKDKNGWSKGIQQSFLTVTHYENIGSTVVFAFSGKYIKHIPIELLTLSYRKIIDNLCYLASIYLTQATDPNGFKIARGYLQFSNPYFQRILNNANWFSPNFNKRYYKQIL